MPISLHLKKEIFPYTILIFVWTVILIFTGVINAGYYLVDNHEIMTMMKYIDDKGIFYTFNHYWSYRCRLDFTHWFHNMAVTMIFRDHLLIWGIYFYLMAVATSIFLYHFFSKISENRMIAILSTVITVIGYHSVVWWSYQAFENLGFFLLSIVLLLFYKAMEDDKKSKIFLPIFLLLLFFVKESFVLLIPFLVLYGFYLRYYNKSLCRDMKYFKFLITSMLIIPIVFFIYYALILKQTNNGYAGWDGFHYYPFLYAIYQLIKTSYGLLLTIFFLFYLLLLIFTKSLSPSSKRQDLKQLIVVIGLMALIIIPQGLIYFKSTFLERYYVPSNIAFGLFFSFLGSKIYQWYKSETNRLISISSIVILSVFFAGFVLLQSKVVIAKAVNYKNECLEIDRTYNFVSNTLGANRTILIAADPVLNFEEAYSLRLHLKDKIKNLNVSILPIDTKSEKTKFDDFLLGRFQKLVDYSTVDQSIDFGKFSCVVSFQRKKLNDTLELLLAKNNRKFFQKVKGDKFIIYQ